MVSPSLQVVYAFIEFENKASADKAIACGHLEFGGHKIVISPRVPKKVMNLEKKKTMKVLNQELKEKADLVRQAQQELTRQKLITKLKLSPTVSSFTLL